MMSTQLYIPFMTDDRYMIIVALTAELFVALSTLFFSVKIYR